MRNDDEFQQWLGRGAIPWRGVQEALKRGVPEDAVPDLQQWAYELVPDALEAIFGPREQAWTTERRAKKDDPARTVLWVVIALNEESS